MEPIDLWLEKQNEIVTRPVKSDAQFRPGINIKWSDFPEAYEHFVWLQGQGLKNPEHEPAVLQRQIPGTKITPPSGWVSTGAGLLGELNMLVSGQHPTMQARWDVLLSDGEDESRINFVRQAISYYRKAALEVMLQDPEFSDLRVGVKEKVKRATDNDPGDDPLRVLRLQVDL